MNLFIIKKNFVIFKAFFSIIFRSILKIKFPLFVEIILTRKCNTNCSYCFLSDNEKSDELDINGWISVIDKIHTLGCRIISIYGGEPTTHKDLLSIIKYAKTKGFYVVINTNGKFDVSMIKDMASSGIDSFILSVDSVNEISSSSKDYINNRIVLEKLIELRKSYDYEIVTSLVITKKNLDTIIPTIKLMNDYKVLPSLGLILKNTYSYKQMSSDLYFLDTNDKYNLTNVIDQIIEMKKNCYKISEPVKYLIDMKEYINNPDFNWICDSGEYSFAVDSDGKFIFCTYLYPENFSIFDIDKNYYKNFKKEKDFRMSKCNKLCFSNFQYPISYWRRNPLSFFLHVIKDF